MASALHLPYTGTARGQSQHDTAPSRNEKQRRIREHMKRPSLACDGVVCHVSKVLPNMISQPMESG